VAGFSVTKHYGWHCEVVFFAFVRNHFCTW
jgi:hypothetical protein